jgi:hypothetical protein
MMEQKDYRLDALKDFMRYFRYEHLPERLQGKSKPFHDLAALVVDGYSQDMDRPSWVQLLRALEKLVEAKDCFVRSGL